MSASEKKAGLFFIEVRLGKVGEKITNQGSWSLI
jgi:hypothetical protein